VIIKWCLPTRGKMTRRASCLVERRPGTTWPLELIIIDDAGLRELIEELRL
jgi:hypothetical protein